jgi:hypothetical protein
MGTDIWCLGLIHCTAEEALHDDKFWVNEGVLSCSLHPLQAAEKFPSQ